MAMDERDISHATGLLGVVFNVGKGGGVEVVTRAGIITSHGGKAFYLPIDRYEVVKEESLTQWCHKNFDYFVRQFVVANSKGSG
jgi:hypothetical protein